MHDSLVPLDLPVRAGAKGASLWACNEAIALVASERNIRPRLLTHQSRCRAKTARARQLAMYLAHVVLGRSLSEIADAFGRDRTTVSYACGRIEDMRDDPVFDEEVSALERRLEAQRVGSIDHV